LTQSRPAGEVNTADSTLGSGVDFIELETTQCYVTPLPAWSNFGKWAR